MKVIEPPVESAAFVLHIPEAIRYDDEELFLFCQANDELQIEREANGDIVVMSPTGGRGCRRELALTTQLDAWAEEEGSGYAFGPTGGFLLPNGAMRSPDAAWVLRERYDKLTDEQKDKFLPLCPEFVVEVRSPRDPLRRLQRKMEEYVQNGAKLGWLLDPLTETAYVYQPGTPVETLQAPAELSGEPLLHGFTAKLARIWGKRL